MGKTMNSQKCSREKLKTFKNWLIYAKHAIFATESSRKHVAKTLKTKILKNFSKCFSRLEVLPARESRGKPRKSLSPLVRNIKNLNFEKYSKYFSRLDQPATESPIQGNIVFWNFDFFFFAKTKDFPKTAKTLKNLFMFDQQGLSIWKHI